MTPSLAKRKRSAPLSGADRARLLELVGHELIAGLDLGGTARRALALGAQAVDAQAGSLVLLDEQSRPVLAVTLHENRFEQLPSRAARRTLRQGIAGWVVDQRQPALASDVHADLRWAPPEEESVEATGRSALCVPMTIQHRLVGIVSCFHPDPDRFDTYDLESLNLFAAQAAVALENARLFAAEEQRRRLADVLSDIARTLTATLDLDEVLDLILDNLSSVVPYDSASIFIMHGDRLTMHASKSFDTELIHDLSFRVDSDHIMARVLTAPDPIVCADVQQESGWENVPAMPPIRGWIGAPLSARGEAVGALTVDSHEPGTYNQEDARMVAAFASHAAIAIANARLWQQIQRRVEGGAFLYQTAQMLTASLELDSVLYSLIAAVLEHFRVEAASVALLDEETNELVFRVAVGTASQHVIGLRLHVDQGIAGWVARSGQPTLVQNARADPRFYRGIEERTGFCTGALMAVPIRLGDETIGVIEVLNPSHGKLDEQDLQLLLNVGALAASAIQNARHYTRARDAEQRYASLFENSADPIVITDADGTITDVNRKMCEVLGYERAVLLGQSVSSFHSQPQATQEQLEQTLNGESIVYRVEALTRDLMPVPFEVRATRVFHDARPFVQWVYHDLTEHLELERVRQNLTHMIVHDLRNPLSSIMSSIELIHSAIITGIDSIPVEQVLQVAQRSGRKLYLLIDSLLDLARLEEGHAALTVREIDVVAMVSEVIEQVLPLVDQYELTLKSVVPPTLPRLYGDRDLLQRVMLNLLDNALKFTPPKGELQIEVGQFDDDSLLFAVTDTGPGIAPEHHEHIFDRFHRLANTAVRGTGLGLALCKLAVEAHGGRIWVESERGHGAAFKFVLPLKGALNPQ